MKGFIGMDRSGSESQLPYVVSAIFMENKTDFSKTYKEIKHICEKYNPILSYAKEIKAKEINSLNTMKNIIEMLVSNNAKIGVLVYNEKPSVIGKGFFKGELKVESVLWFQAANFLINMHRIQPQEIIMDISFTNTKDQSLFDFCVQKLIEKEFGFQPFVKSMDSRYEDEIKIADLIAGFFRKEKVLRNDYKQFIANTTGKEIAKNVSYLRALASHEYP